MEGLDSWFFQLWPAGCRSQGIQEGGTTGGGPVLSIER